MKPEAQYRHITDALVWGGILITVGIVLLLNSLGILSWDLWQFLWRFWPVFLIMAGLNIVFGSTRSGSIVVGVISIVLLLGAVVYSVIASGGASTANFNWNWDFLGSIGNQATMITTDLTVAKDEYSEVKNRNLDVEIGSAKFVVTDNDGDDFLGVQAKHSKGAGEPVLEKRFSNNTLDLNFSTKPGQIFDGGERLYTLSLGQSDLPTALTADLASGTGNIDLDNVKLNSMALVVGSGSMDVTLALVSTPAQKSTIQVSSGTFNMYLDSKVGVKVTYKVSSGSLEIGDTEVDGRGVFTSDNYSSSDIKLELNFEVSSGNAKIKFMDSVVNEG